jgi:hypothetical protein
MTSPASPIVALVFGAFFLCAATCANFDYIASSPLEVVPDWVAGGLLVGAALLSHRHWPSGRVYQIAAWAFMTSLLFASMVGNLEEWLAGSRDADATGLVPMSQGTYLAAVAALFSASLIGLIASLRARNAEVGG